MALLWLLVWSRPHDTILSGIQPSQVCALGYNLATIDSLHFHLPSSLHVWSLWKSIQKPVNSTSSQYSIFTGCSWIVVSLVYILDCCYHQALESYDGLNILIAIHFSKLEVYWYWYKYSVPIPMALESISISNNIDIIDSEAIISMIIIWNKCQLK